MTSAASEELNVRADVCEYEDAAGIARFRTALRTLGAVQIRHTWAIGVDCWQFRIGADTLDVFSDAWSVDIDGPTVLVEQVIRLSQSPAV